MLRGCDKTALILGPRPLPLAANPTIANIRPQMASKNQQQGSDPKPFARRILASPLDSLLFLLPLIVFYEVSIAFQPTVVVAYDLLRQCLQTFGKLGVWAPGAAIVIILLATHIASGRPWTIRWRRVLLMYPEAILATIPLLALSWAASLSAPPPPSGQLISQLAIGIGAGIYEELVFRLILISLIVVVAGDLLKLRASTVAITAILFSSFLFSAHHHPPIGTEPFALVPFAFRALAGVYLATVFWFRGYGSAAGTHAAYNTLILLYGTFYAPA